MKKSILLVFLIFVMFIFCGCSQTNYIIIQKSDGTIEQIFSIELDIQSLNSAGITNQTDIENLKNRVYLEIQNIYTKNMSKFKLTVRTDPNLTDNQKREYEAGVSTRFGWDKNTLAIAILFENAYIYNYYKNFQMVKESVYQSESSNIFTKKLNKEITTVFGQIYKNDMTLVEYYKEMYKEYIITNFSEETFNKLPELTFSYAYVTSYSRTHSDADKTYLTNIGYMHVWNFSADEKEFKINIFYLSAKPVAWYLLALMITFTFIAVYLVVIYFKKGNNKVFINKNFK